MKTRENRNRKKARKSLFNSESAGATVIAAILLLCLIFSVLAVIRIEHIPEWKTDAEESHMKEIENDMAELKSTVDLINLLTSDPYSSAYGFSVTIPFNLGGGEIPVFEPSKSSGTLSVNTEPCNITITTQTSTGSTHILNNQILACGGITYNSNNRRYLDQTLRYENGAVILFQNNRSLMKQFPSFSIVKNQNNESNYTFSVQTINISGDGDSVSSDAAASLRLTGLNNTPVYDSNDSGGINSFNFTVRTEYPDAWYSYFREITEDAGLNHEDYKLFKNNTSDSGLYSVYFEFPAGDKNLERLYVSNSVVQAELGPGSSFKDTSRVIDGGIIKKLPVPGFSVDPQSGCAPVEIQVIDKSQHATNYSYDFGDGTSITTEATPKHTYTTSGTFTIIQTVTNSYGMRSATYPIKIRQIPIANFSNNVSEGEIPLTVEFTDTSEFASGGVTWDFGDGSEIDTSSNPTHTYNEIGTYTVILTASNGVETDSKTETIIATQKPTAEFNADPLVGYAPLSVTFTDLSYSATEWNWDFGDGTVSNGQNPTHTYSQAGSYTVILTAINEYGQDTQSRVITVNTPPPVASFTTSASSGSNPFTVTFTDTSANSPTSWIWNFGDGTPTSTTQNPTHKFTKKGTYRVTLTVSNVGGSAMTYGYITVT